MNRGIGGLLLLETEPCVEDSWDDSVELSESLEWVDRVGLGTGERMGCCGNCCCCTGKNVAAGLGTGMLAAVPTTLPLGNWVCDIVRTMGAMGGGGIIGPAVAADDSTLYD